MPILKLDSVKLGRVRYGKYDSGLRNNLLSLYDENRAHAQACGPPTPAYYAEIRARAPAVALCPHCIMMRLGLALRRWPSNYDKYDMTGVGIGKPHCYGRRVIMIRLGLALRRWPTLCL